MLGRPRSGRYERDRQVTAAQLKATAALLLAEPKAWSIHGYADAIAEAIH